MTRLRFDYLRRTRFSFWTSRSSAVLGKQYDDRASVLTSGDGLWRIAGKAVRFSWKRSPSTSSMRTFTSSVTLRHSDTSSRKWLAKNGVDDTHLCSQGRKAKS